MNTFCCTYCSFAAKDHDNPSCPLCGANICMIPLINEAVLSTQAKTANAYEGVVLCETTDVDEGIYVFTDGATRGAYAAVIVEDGEVIDEQARYVPRDSLPMKNVSAEIMGVALGLRYAPEGSRVHVVSDYLGTGMWLAGLWKIKKPDAMLRLRLIAYLIRKRGLTVGFTHHKGHQKDSSDYTRWNNRADWLCEQKPKED